MRPLFSVTAFALLSASLSAHASSITFNVDPSGSTLSGSITIDPTLGTFTALNLTDPEQTISSSDANYATAHETVAGGNLNIDLDATAVLVLVGTTTLKGYEGGQFSFSDINGIEASAIFDLPSAASSVAPEPSSLALLGTGVLGVAGMVKRRLV